MEVKGLPAGTSWSATVQRQEQITSQDGTWEDADITRSAAGGDVFAVDISDAPTTPIRYIVHTDVTVDGFTLDDDTCIMMVTAGTEATCSFTYRAPIATIRIVSGGDRTPGDEIAPLPDGAVFEAEPVTTTLPPGGPFTCTVTDGQCTIPDLMTGFRWAIHEVEVPDGWYRTDTRGTEQDAATSTPYRFETIPELWGGDVFTVTTSGAFNSLNQDQGYAGRDNRSFARALAASRDNPALPSVCARRIGVVIDQSAVSATDGRNGAVRDALNGAIERLAGTDSFVSVYTFADQAGSAGSLPATSTRSGTGAITDFITGLDTPAGSSNWDRGLQQVIADAHDLDEVVFVTASSPTVFGAQAMGPGDRSTIRMVDEAVFSANAVKAAGVPVQAIGLDLPTAAEANLRAISGEQAGIDYHAATASTLDEIVDGAIAGPCTSSLTIHKQIQDSDGEIIDPTPVLANDWTFENTISSGSITPSVTTAPDAAGNNGFASASITPGDDASPTITVAETGGPDPDYSIDSAQCKVGGTAVDTDVTHHDDGTGQLQFTGAIGEPMECTIVNTASSASISVAKIWHIVDADGGAVIADHRLPEDAADVPDGLESQARVDGEDVDWGQSLNAFTAGSTVSVDEESSVDASLLPGCTITDSSVTDVNGTAPTTGALPFDATLSDGLTAVTITNTVECAQQLTLVKQVTNGSASASDWTLTATAPQGWGARPGPSGSTPVTGPITPDVPYLLSESAGPATYIPESTWVCRTAAGGSVSLAIGAVSVPLGRTVTCTITNVTAQLTVLTHLDGGIARPASDWESTATPANGVDGLDPVTFPGSDGDPDDPPAMVTMDVRPHHDYTLSQALRPGYYTPYIAVGLQRWTGTEWVDVSDPTVQVGTGDHAVYRFVNRAVPAVTLPLTGGTGTIGFAIGGALLAAAGLSAAIWQRRRTRRRGRT